LNHFIQYNESIKCAYCHYWSKTGEG